MKEVSSFLIPQNVDFLNVFFIMLKYLPIQITLRALKANDTGRLVQPAWNMVKLITTAAWNHILDEQLQTGSFNINKP